MKATQLLANKKAEARRTRRLVVAAQKVAKAYQTGTTHKVNFFKFKKIKRVMATEE